jgi:hypothetical protein
MSEITETAEQPRYSPREIALLEHFRSAPSHFGWSFMLKHGASFKVEICGRWDHSDVTKVEKLFGMIAEIIADSADDLPVAPTAKGASDAQP